MEISIKNKSNILPIRPVTELPTEMKRIGLRDSLNFRSEIFIIRQLMLVDG